MTWQLGATTRPWHSISFDEACACIADAGYSEVAIFANEGKIPLQADSTPDEIEAAVVTVRKYDLAPSMLLADSGMSGDEAAAVATQKRLLNVAAEAGVQYVMNCGVGDPAQYDRYIRQMRAIAPYADAKGLQIQLKPHGGIGLTGADLRKVSEAVDHPAFTICYDPGNIIYYTKGASRPETDVHDVASLVTTCIIKDCVVEDGKPDVWIQPGTGLVDFETVLGKLVSAGFRGPFYVECTGGDEIEEINRRAKETFDWLRDLLARLA